MKEEIPKLWLGKSWNNKKEKKQIEAPFFPLLQKYAVCSAKRDFLKWCWCQLSFICVSTKPF